MVAEITLLNPENGMQKTVPWKQGMTFKSPWFPMQVRELMDKSGQPTPVKGSLGNIYRYLELNWPTLYADYDNMVEMITLMGSPEQITAVLTELGTLKIHNFRMVLISPIM